MAKGRILKLINLTKRRDLLTDVLTQSINYIVCPKCGEGFYYEHNCCAINAEKNYAVASLPMINSALPKEKTALFRILNKNNFRLRFVKEFIFLTEKVRIFEFDLDDRALEVIKYTYLAKPMGLGTDAKIILTNTDGNALIFTVFDDYDKTVSTHRVGLDAYAHTALRMEKETIAAPTMEWQKIDLKWAEQYTKEK